MIPQFNQFFAENGEAKRTDYPELGPDSIVFDVGAFKGEFADRIHNKYGSLVYCFEVAPEFIVGLNNKYKDHEKVWVYQHGLGDKTANFNIRHAQNATSIFGQEQNKKGEAEVIAMSEFMAKEMKDDQMIDLIKINIEGPEYDLVDHMIDTGIVKRFRNIQVQFHNFVPDAEARLTSIREKLKETHDQVWNYDFVWESWRLKS
jgi:FkbM family methyltransferase